MSDHREMQQPIKIKAMPRYEIDHSTGTVRKWSPNSKSYVYFCGFELGTDPEAAITAREMYLYEREFKL